MHAKPEKKDVVAVYSQGRNNLLHIIVHYSLLD